MPVTKSLPAEKYSWALQGSSNSIFYTTSERDTNPLTYQFRLNTTHWAWKINQVRDTNLWPLFAFKYLLCRRHAMLLLKVWPESFSDMSVDIDEGVGGRVSNRGRRVWERRDDPRQESGDDQSVGAMTEKILAQLSYKFYRKLKIT